MKNIKGIGKKNMWGILRYWEVGLNCAILQDAKPKLQTPTSIKTHQIVSSNWQTLGVCIKSMHSILRLSNVRKGTTDNETHDIIQESPNCS